jgi:hypothetical protein
MLAVAEPEMLRLPVVEKPVVTDLAPEPENTALPNGFVPAIVWFPARLKDTVPPPAVNVPLLDQSPLTFRFCAPEKVSVEVLLIVTLPLTVRPAAIV